MPLKFPDSLLEKKCTENIRGHYNRPIGECCQLRFMISKSGVLRTKSWGCIDCNAVFKKVSDGNYKKHYKEVQIPAKTG